VVYAELQYSYLIILTRSQHIKLWNYEKTSELMGTLAMILSL